MISVVLAGVLYVAISGLDRGVTTRPIGTAFAVGNPTSGTCWAAGVTNHVCGAAGNAIFNLSIPETSGVTLGDVLLEVKTAAGSVFVNTLAAGFAIMPMTGAVPVAYCALAAGAGLAMTTTFTVGPGYSPSSTITTTMFVLIDTGISTGSWFPSQGNYVVALGIGHYSGVTAGTALP